LVNIDNILKNNSNLKMSKKILVFDLREEGNFENNRVILDNDIVLVIKGSFFVLFKV